ncbi:SNF2-related protein [Sinobaca sp. H24]|uniref:SNF2-related protein n=1 Tax=Sinobaca sp. H24 TaxID=2923376 RepID=UPI00207AA1E0|nr:SNF2-related protein [Sinobaca sp. H24]
MKALTAYGFGGILADDMGLGKTLQTLTYILSERQKNPEAPPFLIVAPSSLIYNWEKEAQRFTPDLKIAVIHGTKPQRKKQWSTYEEADVWITSYPLLRRDEAVPGPCILWTDSR